MKILFISNEYPGPLQKGKGTFNRSMISAIGNRHDVHVVSPIPWKLEFSHFLKTGQFIDRNQEFNTDGIKAEYPRYYYTPKILDHHYGIMMWKSLKNSLLKTVKEFKPDVILSYWAHPDGEVAVRLGELINRPVAVMVGGTDILLLTKQKKRCEAIKNVLNQTGAVISVSHNIRNKTKELNIQSENVHVVYRGVNHKLFQPGDQKIALKKLKLSAEKKHFVYVGRLASVKGLANLVDACRLVADECCSFYCHLLGGGGDKKILSKKIQELGLEGKVILEGAKSQHELATWYQASDAVVLPSLSEGIPNVLLETISCGKSFIATDIGGISEIADKKQDILVPVGDAHKLSEAMIHRINNPSINSERNFTPYSWDESAREIENILQNMIDEKISKKNQPGKLNKIPVSSHI